MFNSPNESTKPDDSNPFLRFKHLLYAYNLAKALNLKEGTYERLVEDMCTSVEKVDPTSTAFRHFTPLVFSEDVGSYLKNETGSVGQSHKGRHLFGLMLSLRVLEEAGILDANNRRPLAVASCGNAGKRAHGIQFVLRIDNTGVVNVVKP
jgi:threonine synthase